jgi:hypothetical protein
MKKNLLRFIMSTSCSLMAFVFLILISCSGSTDSIPLANLGGKVNASGYPDVAGNYSFNTDAISYTCAKGGSGTSSPLAQNYAITQTDNQLSATYSALPAGVTLTESSDMNGAIEKTGNFVMSQTVTATIASISGSNVITYHISGNFNPYGWTGYYTYDIFNNYSNDTCTYKTTFTGDYVSAITSD